MELKARIRNADGSNEEVASFTLTDVDWEILQDYAAYAAELEGNSLVAEGIPSSLSINWSEHDGLRVDAKIPPDEQIDAMLVKLRPFLLKKEPTFFPRVRNILVQSTDNRRVREHLNTLRFLFSGRRLQSLVVAGASSPDYPQGAVINSEEMLDIWLNGYRFHKEKDKQRIFDAMHGLMPPESSIALLLFLITDKVQAILALGEIIALLQGRRETVSAHVIPAEPLHYRVFLHASLVQVSLFELDEAPASLPEEGIGFERVLDLTHLGPASFHQFLDPVGQIWMHGGVAQEIGEHHVFFRVAKGFQAGNREPSKHGMDIIATIKVVAFLTEDPLAEARRKPAQVLLERMRRDTAQPARRVLKAIETTEELATVLQGDPKPVVELIVVPRVAFEFAYWPISSQARERFHRILAEGRLPTFEEVEGSDIYRAWEIYGEPSGAAPTE